MDLRLIGRQSFYEAIAFTSAPADWMPLPAGGQGYPWLRLDLGTGSIAEGQITPSVFRLLKIWRAKLTGLFAASDCHPRDADTPIRRYVSLPSLYRKAIESSGE
jgi:hypothetical protein